MNNRVRAKDQVLFEKLVRAVAVKYKAVSHPAPSVITSYVESTKEWYIAIHTYAKGKRTVQFNGKGAEWHDALVDLVTKFLFAEGLPSAMDELKVIAKGN